ncbi:MAG: hypothetical protein WBB48_07700, partial [Thermodesulfobacteriota bacterium]
LNPGSAGTNNTFQTTGSTPNGNVTFIWGFNETVFPADTLCGGLEVDILNFRNLRTVRADPSGNAFFNVSIPGSFGGISVVLQAVDISSCTKSNLNMETL